MAVGSALAGQRDRAHRRVAVQHPIMKFFRSSRTDVRRKVGLRTDEFAKAHELVRAEMVCFAGIHTCGNERLPKIVRTGTLVHRSDTVPPVVAVGKTAPWPAHIWSADVPHVHHKVSSNTVEIRSGRIRTDPDAVVNHPTQMLDEMSVEVWTDDRLRLARTQLDGRARNKHLPSEAAPRQSANRDGRLQKVAALHLRSHYNLGGGERI